MSDLLLFLALELQTQVNKTSPTINVLTGQQANKHVSFDKYKVMWTVIEIHARSRDGIDERAVCFSKAAQGGIWTENITGTESKHVFNRFFNKLWRYRVGRRL